MTKEEIIQQLQGKWKEENAVFQFEIKGHLLYVNDSQNPVSGMDFTLKESPHNNLQFYCPEIMMVADFIESIGKDNIIIRSYLPGEVAKYNSEGKLSGGTLHKFDRI